MNDSRKMIPFHLVRKADCSNLGKLIRERRAAKRLTQEQLAAVFGINKNAVGAWELGRNLPKVEDIPTLCDILDISLYEFFGLETPFEGTQEGSIFFNKVGQLNDYNRMLLHRLADTMLDAQEEARREKIVQNICRIFQNEEKTAAGYGNPLGDYRRGAYIYLHGNDLIWQADEVITVTGDSMEPTYHDGDELLVQYVECILPGQIGVFVADGEGLVKEYQEDGLHSHNPMYPVRYFTEDDNVRCVGRVLGRLERSQYASQEEIDIYKDYERKKRI